MCLPGCTSPDLPLRRTQKVFQLLPQGQHVNRERTTRWVEWRKRQRAAKRDRGRLSSEREVTNEQRRQEMQERKEGSTCMGEVKRNMERNGDAGDSDGKAIFSLMAQLFYHLLPWQIYLTA